VNRLLHITLQNQYHDIVKKKEVIKVYYQGSLKELENLYGSLSQRAFKGELDLSRMDVPAPEDILKEEVVSLL